MDFSMSAVFSYFINYYYVEQGKNRAIQLSFPALTSTSGDIATPPVQVDSYNTD